MKTILLILVLFCFFYFHLNRYLTFESIKNHNQLLLQWVNDHYFLTAVLYILLYCVVIAASIPGALFFTLTGGFLFGIWFGSLFAILGATLGATILFLAVKLAFADWVRKKSAPWLIKMEKGFQQNAFNYLLALREGKKLIPLGRTYNTNISAKKFTSIS